MKRLALALVVSGSMILAISGGALAADTMYMTATGQRQGLIRGSVVAKGVEGWMKVVDFDHGVVSPRDPASGLPTGARQHKQVVVRILLDKSAPQLIRALVNNENLTSVEIAFFRDVLRLGVTAPTKVFSVVLTNANVASETLLNPDEKTPPGGAFLEVAFTYQSIQWSWGSITAIDDWAAGAIH